MKSALWLALTAIASATVAAQTPELTAGVRALRAAAGRRDPVTLMTGATTTLAALNTEVVTVGPGEMLHPSAPHGDVEELIIVKDGSLRATVNGHSRVLGRGSVVVVRPSDEHELRNAGAPPLACYVFAYRSKAAPDSLRATKAGGSFFVDWNDVVAQHTETGAVRRVFDRATTMFDRFEMHVSTLNQGLTNHAAHTHHAEEIVVVLRGDVRMLIGDRRQNATAGDVIFLASGVPHSLDNIGKGPAEYFAFQWQ